MSNRKLVTTQSVDYRNWTYVLQKRLEFCINQDAYTGVIRGVNVYLQRSLGETWPHDNPPLWQSIHPYTFWHLAGLCCARYSIRMTHAPFRVSNSAAGDQHLATFARIYEYLTRTCYGQMRTGKGTRLTEPARKPGCRLGRFCSG